MYAPDESPYSYLVPRPIEGVLSIGWLDAQYPFPRGIVEGRITSKLKLLAKARPVRLTRGYQQCPFCAYRGESSGAERRLGSAEIWIPREGGFFAAPDLVVHYIEAHEYSPPTAFVSAVDALDIGALPTDFAARVALLLAEASAG